MMEDLPILNTSTGDRPEFTSAERWKTRLGGLTIAIVGTIATLAGADALPIEMNEWIRVALSFGGLTMLVSGSAITFAR